MAKLSNIFKGNTIRLTQSPHGRLQSNKSIDCTGPNGDLNLYAPYDGVITKVYGTGTQRGFWLKGKGGWEIIFHHAIPSKGNGAIIKQGEYLGKSSWHHIHTAIKVNGVYDVILNYMNRTISIGLASGFRNQKWKNWSTWADKQLPGTPPQSSADPLKTQKEALYKFLEEYRPDVTKVFSVQNIFGWWDRHGSIEIPKAINALSHENGALKLSISEMKTVNTSQQEQIQKLLKDNEELRKNISAIQKKLDEKTPINLIDYLIYLWRTSRKK